MELLETMAQAGHEQLIAVQDADSGLRAWIALHHTKRGPAFGGIRVWSYRNEEEAALDALRLSQAMTFKCVLAGIPGGGGKTVVLVDSLRDRRKAVRVLGEAIQNLGGLYQAGPDAGFDEHDQRHLAETTQWVARFHDGVLRPAAEATAEGAEWAIRAALKHVDTPDLQGVRVAVQGLGAVGLALSRRLIAGGAEVYGSDLKVAACEHARDLGVRLLDPTEILRAEVDVFVPCAMGGVLHELSIPRLGAKIVAPVANNALASEILAEAMHERGVLYLPDFVLNAGALIEGAGYESTGRTDWSNEIRAIGDTVTSLLGEAAAGGQTPMRAAAAQARRILDAEAAQAALPTA
jgi:leucine dehydrogenase